MALNKKVLLIVGITTFMLIGTLHLTARIILLDSFERIEARHTRENIQRVLSAMDSDLSALSTFVYDWAGWDDTYEFILDVNEEYIESNLTDTVFTPQRLNVIIYVDASGKIKFAKAYDRVEEKEIPIPPGLVTFLADSDILTAHPDTESNIGGIVCFPSGPMLIASRPIITSEHKGPIRGTLIMGRLWNDTEVERLAEIAHISLDVRPLDAQPMPNDFVAARASLSKQAPFFIRFSSNELIAGFTMLKDIHNNPCLLLKVEMARDIHSQAKDSLSYYLRSTVVIGLAICALVYLLLKKLVVNRLVVLAGDVRRIDIGPEPDGRVEVRGNDELAFLGGAINKMLDDLSVTHQGLREAAEKYRLLAENATDLIWTRDMNLNTTYLSPAVERLTGFGIDEALSMSISERMTPASTNSVMETLAEELANEEHGDADPARTRILKLEMFCKDGSTVWVETTMSFIRDNSGQPSGILGISRDITERKRAEEELRESEERYRDLVNQLPDIVWRLNREGAITFISSSVKSVSGYEQEELVGRSFEKLLGGFLAEGSADEARDLLKRRLQGELGNKDILFELTFRRKDGTEFIGEVRSTPLVGPNNEVKGIQGILRDITERKRGMEDLERSQRSLSEAQRIAHMGSWEWDISSGRGHWSDETSCIFGFVPGQVEATFDTFVSVLHPDDRERVRQEIGEVFEGLRPYNLEFRIVRPSGETRHLEAHGDSLVRDDNGKPLKMLGTLLDITERKQAEEERRQFEEQMQQTQKLESLGVMAGGIAHDFNNILFAILGNADLALMEMPPEAIGRHFLQEIQTAARRASGLTDQMLAYSGKGALAIEKMDLSGLVQEMAHLLEVSHTKKAIVKYRFEENLSAIKGDPSQLRQVVMNLITNASEAVGEEGGFIMIETGVTEATQEYLATTYANDELPGGRYVYLEVADTGCGMDEEARRRIFEPFFTTKFTGRGLGMAAVLGIMRAHKGAIDIQSEVDRGTTIKVLFPALDETAKRPVEEAPREEDWSAHGTVLVVDDETQIRRFEKLVLERKGFTVLTTEDGRQATALFREHKNDIVCVLLDLTMPHMGGEETFVELHQIRKDVPVVLVSGYSEEQLKERVEDLGFAGFLKKPVGSRELLDKVRAVLTLTERI